MRREQSVASKCASSKKAVTWMVCSASMELDASSRVFTRTFKESESPASMSRRNCGPSSSPRSRSRPSGSRLAASVRVPVPPAGLAHVAVITTETSFSSSVSSPVDASTASLVGKLDEYASMPDRRLSADTSGKKVASSKLARTRVCETVPLTPSTTSGPVTWRLLIVTSVSVTVMVRVGAKPCHAAEMSALPADSPVMTPAEVTEATVASVDERVAAEGGRSRFALHRRSATSRSWACWYTAVHGMRLRRVTTTELQHGCAVAELVTLSTRSTRSEMSASSP
mmetsp:Transcript_13551/g.40993  ORF Transcript_13551/g.40993 Transcript_13551/m.40993 type:complete len:283 (+) Transcript_13551:1432-2280(+)